MKETHPYIHAVAATATAKRAVIVNPKRAALLVANNSEDYPVELTHGERIPYGDGIPIAPQSCYENEEYCQGEYWLRCDTGQTADVRIEEDIITE